MIDIDVRWDTVTRKYCGNMALRVEVLADLLQAYSEPGRFYHTQDHLRTMFTELDTVYAQLEEPDAVEFAVWFHDVVYDSRRPDNEALSAERAQGDLERLGVDAGLIQSVMQLVLATAGHDAYVNTDGAFFLDADLAILGAAPEMYERYRTAIRNEYAWVEESQYRAGRAEVLERFAVRDSIYRTSPFSSRYETQARVNLAAELAALRGAS